MRITPVRPSPHPRQGVSSRNKDVRVSVLVLTYNHDRYLPDALDSAVAQETSFDFEIIVVDDGSSDGTRAVAQRYADDYPDLVRLCPLRKWKGVVHSVREGLAACRGSFVAILEGDDYWTVRFKLQIQLDFLNDHPNCSFCAANRIVKNEFDNTLEGPISVRNDLPFVTYPIERLIETNFIGNSSPCMYRMSVINDIDENFWRLDVGDWIFNIVNAQAGPIGLLSPVMSVYRKHPGSKWSSLPDLQKVAMLERLADAYDAYLGYKYASSFDKFRQNFVGRLRSRAWPGPPPTAN